MWGVSDTKEALVIPVALHQKEWSPWHTKRFTCTHHLQFAYNSKLGLRLEASLLTKIVLARVKPGKRAQFDGAGLRT